MSNATNHSFPLNRRRWLHGMATGLVGGMAWGSGWQAWAAPQTKRRLLVVLLRGAYDATNLLVQLDSRLYYDARPNLAIAKPGRGGNGALALTDGWGLHPALADTLWPLWASREIAFVPFSGLESPSRSHFEMQDRIEAGLAGEGALRTDSGFVNRLAGLVAPKDSVSFTATLPTAARGAVRMPNVDLRQTGATRLSDADAKALQRMYAGHALEGTVREAFDVKQTVERELSAGDMHPSSRGAMTPQGFRALAPRIGKLLQGAFRVGFVDVGQWDTHVNQGGATGALADRLADLSGGLVALQDELGAAWADTTVVVISEFGRTFAENGNRGTDHGAGSAMWVMGGAVKGGRLAGAQRLMQTGTLHDGRDWPVLNDYRAVLGGLAAEWYGLDATALGQVFPGVKPVDLNLI